MAGLPRPPEACGDRQAPLSGTAVASTKNRNANRGVRSEAAQTARREHISWKRRQARRKHRNPDYAVPDCPFGARGPGYWNGEQAANNKNFLLHHLTYKVLLCMANEKKSKMDAGARYIDALLQETHSVYNSIENWQGFAKHI